MHQDLPGKSKARGYDGYEVLTPHKQTLGWINLITKQSIFWLPVDPHEEDNHLSMWVPPHPSFHLAVASMLLPLVPMAIKSKSSWNQGLRKSHRKVMESLVALYGTLCNSGLLVVSASDWAWESLGSAPAVAPGVSALVFPLGILSKQKRQGNPALAEHQQHRYVTEVGNEESEVCLKSTEI